MLPLEGWKFLRDNLKQKFGACGPYMALELDDPDDGTPITFVTFGLCDCLSRLAGGLYLSREHQKQMLDDLRHEASNRGTRIYDYFLGEEGELEPRLRFINETIQRREAAGER